MTDYFRDDVLVKRPLHQTGMVLVALDNPVRRETQVEDGRIRHWVFVPELGRFPRVVTVPDGMTFTTPSQTGGSHHEN